MARRLKPGNAAEKEWEAAYRRSLALADRCAAQLFGEEPPRDPDDGSPRAVLMALGMVYFLVRMAPADLQALGAAGGLHARFHRPLGTDYPRGDKAPFAGCWWLGADA